MILINWLHSYKKKHSQPWPASKRAQERELVKNYFKETHKYIFRALLHIR